MRSVRDPISRCLGSACGAVLGGLLLLVSCRDATGPRPQRQFEITVVSGGGARDTIGASLADLLVVRLHDQHGAPRVGSTIRFETFLAEGGRFGAYHAFVRDDRSSYPGTLFLGVTDSSGRAAVRVSLGVFAGPTFVMVSVPELGVQTAVPFTVLPGAAKSITLAPADTAVYVGNGYRLRGSVLDRNGNVRPERPAFSGTAAVQIDESGMLSARAIGRVVISATAGAASAVAYSSVVPRGVVAARRHEGLGLILLELDGSRYESLYQRPVIMPSWVPGAPRIVYAGGYSPFYDGLHVVDTTGLQRTIVRDDGIRFLSWPQASRDGAWVYFAADSTPYSPHMIYRVRHDGSGRERLTPFPDGEAGTPSDPRYDWPSPSPDGRRLAYAGTDHSEDSTTVRVLDLGTRVRTNLGVRGYGTRWSPVDDRVAFMNHAPGGVYGLAELRVVQADGSGARTLMSGSVEPGFDWSPDGKWMIVRSGALLNVVDVESGLALPLAFTANLVQPTWRR